MQPFRPRSAYLLIFFGAYLLGFGTLFLALHILFPEFLHQLFASLVVFCGISILSVLGWVVLTDKPRRLFNWWSRLLGLFVFGAVAGSLFFLTDPILRFPFVVLSAQLAILSFWFSLGIAKKLLVLLLATLFITTLLHFGALWLLTALLSAPLLLVVTSAAFMALGLTLGLYCIEKTPPDYYLRVANGEDLGQIYPITKDLVHIGSSPTDDFCFAQYLGVRPTHIKLVKYTAPKAYFLINNSLEDTAMVNYRAVSEQVLEDGDLITCGHLKVQFFIAPP